MCRFYPYKGLKMRPPHGSPRKCGQSAASRSSRRAQIGGRNMLQFTGFAASPMAHWMLPETHSLGALIAPLTMTPGDLQPRLGAGLEVNGEPMEEKPAIEVLSTLGMDELRKLWRDGGNSRPPPHLKPVLLRELAWRIQSEAQGGIDAETRRLLRTAVRRAKMESSGPRRSAKRKRRSRPRPRVEL